MQQVISGALPLAGERDRAVASHAQPRAAFGSVLQATFAVFAHYPLPILACSLLCFAGVVIVGALSYAAVMLHGMAMQNSYFALAAHAFYLQMQIQAAIGAFTFLIGRGAITWIALRVPACADDPARAEVTLRAAFGAALRRWRPLLASSLLYGALITLSLVGITWMLREARLDVSNYRWVRRDANSILNMTVVRAIAQLPPDPGSPFTELYSATRYHLARQSGSSLGWSLYQPATLKLPAPLLLAGIAGALLAFATEALLCMRTARIMHAPERGIFQWLAPTLRLSLTHFWRVAAWRWSVRLAVVVLSVAGLTLPIALHQGIMIPAMVSEVRAYWPYPVNISAYTIGTALISVFTIPFSLSFEARMYLALTNER
ncbi:MAG: hypothetical protein KatS3mg053_0088 [Candidatus Roseilinea sp.]|nr:MAG: hypothetical protein KatS3mg053_0088 [Candidatus Roseilinea sp.]